MEVREPPATYIAYRALPEDAPRYEIIAGAGSLTPSPNRYHQLVSARLYKRLSDFVEANELGEVYYAPFDVILSENDVVNPDILFVARARLAIIHYEGVFGPPDLVVEIISPTSTRRDLEQKLALYARYGVREYWIADPASQTVDIWISAGAPLDTRQVLAGEGTLVSGILPGLEIPMSRIFAGLLSPEFRKPKID